MKSWVEELEYLECPYCYPKARFIHYSQLCKHVDEKHKNHDE